MSGISHISYMSTGCINRFFYGFCAIARLVTVFHICNPMYDALCGTMLAVVPAVQWQQVCAVNISPYFDIILVSIDK